MMKNCSFVHQLKNDSYGLHERIERGHTVCDKEGKILQIMINLKKRIMVTLSDRTCWIVTRSLPGEVGPVDGGTCHECLHDEKNGVKKLIYQTPWYENGEFMGLVEFSLEIPFEMPHYIRKPKTE